MFILSSEVTFMGSKVAKPNLLSSTFVSKLMLIYSKGLLLNIKKRILNCNPNAWLFSKSYKCMDATLNTKSKTTTTTNTTTTTTTTTTTNTINAYATYYTNTTTATHISNTPTNTTTRLYGDYTTTCKSNLDATNNVACITNSIFSYSTSKPFRKNNSPLHVTPSKLANETASPTPDLNTNGSPSHTASLENSVVSTNNTHNHDTNENDEENLNYSDDLLTLQNTNIQESITKIKIAGLNVCGLRSKLKNGIFELFAKNFDILCLSETKTQHVDLSRTILLNYTCLVKEKSVSNHHFGGVHGLCMIVKSGFAQHAQVINEMQSPYVLWVRFENSAFSLPCIIGAVYLPGENSRHKDEGMFDQLAEDIFNLKQTYDLPIFMIGDWNSRTGTIDDILNFDQNLISNCGLEDIANELIDLSPDMLNANFTKNRHNKDNTENDNGKSLINLCRVLSLRIINGRIGKDKELGEFTFKSPNGNSTIDYCIATQNSLPHIEDFEVDTLDQNLSDFHSPVILTLKTNHTVNINNNVNDTISSDIDYQPIHTKWCNEKKEEFQMNFNLIEMEEVSQLLSVFAEGNTDQENMDEIVNKITDMSIKSGLNVGMSKRITKNGRSSKSTNANKPWFDRDCEEKRRQYFRVKNRLKKCKSFQNEATLKIEAKAYKDFLNRKFKSYNKNIHKKLRDLKSHKPNEYWKLLSTKKPNSNTHLNILDAYNHFKNLNQNINNDQNFDPNNIANEGDDFLNSDFTFEELSNIVKNLKNNKSNGIDNIINEFIKYSPIEYKLIILKLFNLILKTGVLPKNWCISFISPIYKNKGSKNDANNYRGISLISCLGKLFTALINDRLTKFVENNAIIGEEQAGFRSGYSTHDHIFTLYCIVDMYLNKIGRKKRLYCAFVDYQKAFDLVDRSSLWLKLIQLNINGRIMKLIYNLYQNTKACVKLNNCISNSFECNTGVRQGDNLSPLLFSLFLNDFETFLSTRFSGLRSIENLWQGVTMDEIQTFLKLFVLLYADDTVIMAEDPKEMQLALNALGNYCDLWNLNVNIDKTKIMRFSLKKPTANTILPDFWLNGQKIEYVESYTYLGTVFSFNGKFDEAINKQILQANRALFVLKSKKDMFNLPIDIMLDLFEKTIVPILLYGCEIWGHVKNIDRIEKFHRKFLKYLLNIKIQTANSMVYGETGRVPLNMIIDLRMVCFWHRVSIGSSGKLSFKMLTLLNKLKQAGQFTSKWLLKVEQTLTNCGMRDVWLNPVFHNHTWVKRILKTKLTEISNLKWHNHMWQQSSCLIYRSLKDNLVLEKYLTLLSNSDRITLCKFRCRNSRIPVVTLSFNNNNIPYEERVCSVCNMNEIGDEFHYILQCPALTEYRNNLISNYYVRNPSMYKFVQLFQSKNVKVLVNLAKFIREINRILR